MNAREFYALIEQSVRNVLANMRNPWARMATIDPAYTTGLPKLQWDGEVDEDGVTPILSTKTYTHMSSYTPAAGDRVVVKKVGEAWIIEGSYVGP